MQDDHLDKETQISIELTRSGVKASTRSRMIAAIDRLGGALLDGVIAYAESGPKKRRAKTAAELRMIEAVADLGIEEIKSDPALAQRAVSQFFKRTMVAQTNKEAILKGAVENIKSQPTKEGEDDGQISEAFLHRFESYAEFASSDEIRSIFASLLAGEVRRPGTVSASLMHFASLLDADIAAIIDRVLPYAVRHGQIYLQCMPNQLTVPEIAKLEMAGFCSAEKTHTIELDSQGLAIRQIGNGEGIVIYGAPHQRITLNIAILSSAGMGMVEVISSSFDTASFSKCMMSLGATECKIGTFRESDGKWYVENLQLVICS